MHVAGRQTADSCRHLTRSGDSISFCLSSLDVMKLQNCSEQQLCPHSTVVREVVFKESTLLLRTLSD